MKIKPCEICGTEFNNIFEMVDHLVEDNGEPEFDPALVLPNGYKLLVGTLLRLVYDRSNKPSQVREIVSGAFTTLYLAETDQKAMRASVEDVIVSSHMSNIDKELKKLLEEDDYFEEGDK